MHPILEPLVTQLPANAISRKLIESGDEYLDILGQLASEGLWCKSPETVDNDNKLNISTNYSISAAIKDNVIVKPMFYWFEFSFSTTIVKI